MLNEVTTHHLHVGTSSLDRDCYSARIRIRIGPTGASTAVGLHPTQDAAVTLNHCERHIALSLDPFYWLYPLLRQL